MRHSKYLAGSKGLSNFTKNLIGVSHSKLDPNKRYIKQLKSRSKQKEYFDQVIECALEKEAGSALLEWKFLAVNAESLHLAAPEQEMSNDEICQLAFKLYHVEKKNWEQCVDEINLSPTNMKDYDNEFSEESKKSSKQKSENSTEKVS